MTIWRILCIFIKAEFITGCLIKIINLSSMYVIVLLITLAADMFKIISLKLFFFLSALLPRIVSRLFVQQKPISPSDT